MKTLTKVLLIIAGLLVLLLFVVNPYRYHAEYNGRRSIVQKIEINAPPETIFKYLGNSANAATWSVFVDHITPLNPNEVPDGQVGSQRRCFTREDETGSTWDETLLIVEPYKRRRISCYNLKDFPLIAEGLNTEQIYNDLGNNKTELVFTVFFNKKPDAFTAFKTRIASWVIKYIFKGNMENIKTESEKLVSR